jgi:trimeric autotransporter adhesin
MKKIYYILTLLLCVYVQTANAQMGVNATGAAPATSAMLDVSSTTKGFLMPRMTTAQRTTLGATAINGMQVYDSDLGEVYLRRPGIWSPMNVPRSAFSISDNSASPIVWGFNTGTGIGVQGNGGTGSGVVGSSTSGFGVYGISSSNFGVYGISTTNVGVYGSSTSGYGVIGLSGSNIGIYGENNSASLPAGKFVNNNANGTAGRFEGTNGTGVYGVMTGTGIGVASQTNSGTAGDFNSSSGTGVNAFSTSSYGIVAGNGSATIPVAQFANLSGGTALELVASTAVKITGAIKVAGGSFAPAFKITTNTAVGGNTSGNALKIPNTTLANNANDILLVTHNYSPTNTYLNKAHGVYWDGTNWNIFLEEGPIIGVMPNNIAFNVLVIKQ